MSLRDIAPGARDKTIGWTRDMWINVGERYSQMLTLLFDNLDFLSSVSRLMDGSDVDTFASAIINVSLPAGRAMHVAHATMNIEFERATYESGTILRSNSLATKLQTALSRRVGNKYAVNVLRHWMLEIVGADCPSFEVDPNKAGQFVDVNRRNLENASQKVLDTLCKQETIDLMPPLIRSIAASIASLAATWKLDPADGLQLVGGFILLRFFCPVILTPDALDALPEGTTVTPAARRNLVLVAKLLMNLANGVEFGTKEVFMVPLNEFFNRNAQKMTNWLQNVIKDAETVSDEDTTVDLVNSNSIRNLQLNDLVVLHRILQSCVQKEPKCKSDSDGIQALKSHLLKLGPPPLICRSNVQATKPASVSQSEISTEGQYKDNMERLMAMLDESNFYFQGPKSKKGESVIYMVVSRLPVRIFDMDDDQGVEVFVDYLERKASHALDAPYVFVIDMSWSRLSTDMQRKIFAGAGRLVSHFSRQHRKNLKHVFIVHPSSFTRAVVMVLRPFTSRKLQRKIVNIHDWKELRPFISETQLALPVESRGFITKSYRVTKVNAKGKRQERVIKFTLASLLNMDAQSRAIKNEMRLCDITEITCELKWPIIDMRFDDAVLTRGISRFFADDEDRRRRHYEFRSIEDRNAVIEDIFESGFLGSRFPPEFEVIKINENGKKQKRIIILTRDSLLNVKESGGHREIKREISYAGLERVELELDKGTTETGQVWLLVKTDKMPRSLITPQARLLYDAIQEGMNKFKTFEESEDQSFSSQLADQSVEGARHTREVPVRLRGMTLGLPRPSERANRLVGDADIEVPRIPAPPRTAPPARPDMVVDSFHTISLGETDDVMTYGTPTQPQGSGVLGDQ